MFKFSSENFKDLLQLAIGDCLEIVLVSNNVVVTDSLISNLSSLKNPLFVYHNHAQFHKELQGFYPKKFRECLFLMRRDESRYWGINEDQSSTIFHPKNSLEKTCIFLVHGGAELLFSSAYSASISIVGNEFVKNMIATGYPAEKTPTIGFISRITFKNLMLKNNLIHTVGFNLNNTYVSNLWSGHGWEYERTLLNDDFWAGNFIRLD